MIGRLFVGGIILVCCGCSTATMHTDVTSTKWRMENLEQRFLDFREKAALREAGLSTRITKLEKQLGIPVPTQKEMIAASTQLTSDVHVFTSPDSANDVKKSVVDDLSVSASGSGAKSPAVKKTFVKKSVEAGVHSSSEQKTVCEPALTVSLPKGSIQSSTSKTTATVQPTSKPLGTPSGKPSASPSVKQSAISSVQPSITSAPRVVSQAAAPAPKRTVRPAVKKTGSTSMYKHGLQLLEKGRHIEGRERLEEFLTEFPHDPLVPNAVYWVGESFYSQKDYLVAVDLFREVLRRFPESTKASAAMLKIGYSYERVGELSEARRFLLKVVEKYPKSNEARLARKMLSGI